MARGFDFVISFCVICYLIPWVSNNIYDLEQSHYLKEWLVNSGRVPQWQPHRRSGLATLPSVGAIP